MTILLSGGVLFGCTALAVDVGSLMFERRQLQNGADSAASSLAMACADNMAACTMSNTSTAAVVNRFNNVNNTKDQVGGIDSVCGNSLVTNVVASMPLCPASTGGTTDCPPVSSALATANVPWVEVHTKTQQADGTSAVPNVITRMVTGASATTVKACARAAWGPAGVATLNILPVVMSYCDWKAQTGYDPLHPNNPGLYPPSPTAGQTPGYGTVDNPWPALSWERAVYTQGSTSTCTTWNGHVAPGGFSVIQGTTSCQVASSIGDWFWARPGNSRPCDSTIFDGYRGKIVYIPIFDCLSYQAWPTYDPTNPPAGGCNNGNGSNTYYHVSMYAAFYLTGWYFSSSPQPSIVPGSTFGSPGHPCVGGDRCMYGFFVKDLITGAQLQALQSAVVPGPQPPNGGLQTATPVG
ncbi:pilus assembly protein TadG-related protein [Nostocoides sp. HKS02]|uniref:pilus assembly protein TadG-related protein n=1 Tax=Nostocoides sp. HKS02 TaxID=1813880 RepID=UPI0018A86B9F|nr:Tad domain-containing protein [Tetrasphaera sp. HKS02]